MKDLTITVRVPEQADIERAARRESPIKPRPAIVLNIFVDDDEMIEYLRSCDEFDKSRTASDIVASYCEQHNISWASINGNMIHIADHCHMVITAAVEIHE